MQSAKHSLRARFHLLKGNSIAGAWIRTPPTTIYARNMALLPFWYKVHCNARLASAAGLYAEASVLRNSLQCAVRDVVWSRLALCRFRLYRKIGLWETRASREAHTRTPLRKRVSRLRRRRGAASESVKTGTWRCFGWELVFVVTYWEGKARPPLRTLALSIWTLWLSSIRVNACAVYST